MQQVNSAEHLRREESTDVGIHSIGVQTAKTVQPFDDNCYANETCAKMETELVGDKNLQELKINGTREITDAGGGAESSDKPPVTETSGLGICTKRQPVDECSDFNYCSML